MVIKMKKADSARISYSRMGAFCCMVRYIDGKSIDLM